MAELVTIARPYAEAVFDLAKQQNALQQWSDMLAVAEAVAADPQMQACIDNPRLTQTQKEELFLSVCGDRLDESGRNFIRVLLDNNRLKLMPHVRSLFEELKAGYEGVIKARVISAFPMEEAQVRELAASLEARFKRKIETEVSVDQDLIGGVKVEVGDEVIDASVRGKLDSLALTLKR